MNLPRLALLLGISCSGATACGPPSPPAAVRQPGSSELTWHRLAKESDPSLGSPPSLRSEDGTVSNLRSIEIRATVVPPFATTELELVFDEIPAGRGSATFSLDLPAGAAVSRFAVHDGGGWHDAETIAREQAPSDIAPVEPVFETDTTQNFSARVQRRPGERPRLLVEYTTGLLDAEAPYRVRLGGLPRLDALRASVRVLRRREPRTYHLEQKNFAPDRDFSLSAEKVGRPSDFEALRAGKYAAARILPEATRSAELTFLVDTSASQPVPLPTISGSLRALTESLAAEKTAPLVTVIAFDQEVQPIVVRSKPPLAPEQLAPLVARGRLGGTDLASAIWTPTTLGLPDEHLILVSDFEHTMAPAEDIVSRHGLGPKRIDSLVPNTDAEQALREKFSDPFGVRPHVPHAIVRSDDDPKRLVSKLLQPTPSKTTVNVKGASWSLPPSDEGSQGNEFSPGVGESIYVFAEYEGSAPLEVEVNGEAKPRVPPVDDQTLSVLLKRVVGAMRMNQLLSGFRYGGYDNPAEAARALSEVSRLSKEYGLLSPLSSFIVNGADQSRHLAGRVVDSSRTRLVRSMTMVPPREPAPRADKCPELVSLRQADRTRGDCPPLYVDFGLLRPRVVADVSFAGAEPLPKSSPHLDQLADLLTLRPELTEVAIKVASKPRADGVVRYLVERGVHARRIRAERLLEGEIEARKPTPKCKTAGQQVVLEVLSMSLEHLNQRAIRKPVQPVVEPPPSRLAAVAQSIREARRTRGRQDLEEALSDALRSSERWIAEEPKNPLAYIALGDVLVAQRDDRAAARAYGSLFDLDVPGGGLDVAAALRIQKLGWDGRRWQLGMRAFRQIWEDSKRPDEPEGDVEGSRAYAYAALWNNQVRHTASRRPTESGGGLIYEAAEFSTIVARIEAPVFAQIALHEGAIARWSAESLLTRRCSFPMQGSVLGAVLSWEDSEAELEVDMTALEEGFTYDSVLTDRTPRATLKWLPLPEDGNSYPIRVSVRAERLGKKGYAFGVVRVINHSGRGRVFIEQTPFVVSAVGERVPVYNATILQRPQ